MCSSGTQFYLGAHPVPVQSDHVSCTAYYHIDLAQCGAGGGAKMWVACGIGCRLYVRLGHGLSVRLGHGKINAYLLPSFTPGH